MPRTKADTPADETKAQKFVRLADMRTNKALNAIANIGGLASRVNYEYTDAQAQAILTALDNELKRLVERFNKPEATAKTGFSLSEATAADTAS